MLRATCGQFLSAIRWRNGFHCCSSVASAFPAARRAELVRCRAGRALGHPSAQPAARYRAPARSGLPGACSARQRRRLPAGAGRCGITAVTGRRRGADRGGRLARRRASGARDGRRRGTRDGQTGSPAAAPQRPARQCRTCRHRQHAGCRNGVAGRCGPARAVGRRLSRPDHAAAGLSAPFGYGHHPQRRARAAGELRAALVPAGLGLRTPGLAQPARGPDRSGGRHRRAVRSPRIARRATPALAQGDRRSAVSVPGAGASGRHGPGIGRAHPALAGCIAGRWSRALLAGSWCAEHARAGSQPVVAGPAVRRDCAGQSPARLDPGAGRVAHAAGPAAAVRSATRPSRAVLGWLAARSSSECGMGTRGFRAPVPHAWRLRRRFAGDSQTPADTWQALGKLGHSAHEGDVKIAGADARHVVGCAGQRRHAVQVRRR
ncbi:hypothetical protein XAP6984_1090057 [Xanthomonas phaseoli pv. phaseoli]|uniref:Uncharacterized protein n=1 Tax=Xanthomonas campestris pv. phaseoli TaxID=317013 RepID=A0ABY1TPF4_XANCH|nr:hypothetical protein XAP6984_1090057 [Xanthomonas phaseoli pv. phaseoli]